MAEETQGTETTTDKAKNLDLNKACIYFMGACLAVFLVAVFCPNFSDARLNLIVDQLQYFGLAAGVGGAGYVAGRASK
jgi:hypothetical protein